METLYSLRVDPLTPMACSKTSSETSKHSDFWSQISVH